MDELRLKGRRPKGRRKFMWEILTAKMCVCVQNVTQASQSKNCFEGKLFLGSFSLPFCGHLRKSSNFLFFFLHKK